MTEIHVGQRGPKQKLELYTFDAGQLAPEDVEIALNIVASVIQTYRYSIMIGKLAIPVIWA